VISTQRVQSQNMTQNVLIILEVDRTVSTVLWTRLNSLVSNKQSSAGNACRMHPSCMAKSTCALTDSVAVWFCRK